MLGLAVLGVSISEETSFHLDSTAVRLKTVDIDCKVGQF